MSEAGADDRARAQARARDRAIVRFLSWWRDQGGSNVAPTVATYLERFPHDAAFEAEFVRERDGLLDPISSGSEGGLPGVAKQRIGRFEVLRELGRGGQGVVYLARDPDLSREVALKVLHPHRISGEAKERLKREADALARIEDPGIATVYEVELEGPTPYLAMRFVPGRSLQGLMTLSRAAELTEPRLGSAEPADVRAVIELGLGCARALERAHQAGVVHRDVKPGNVQIDADGRPVLIDFGLARDDLSSGQDLTHSGERPGTPRYMSPEQLWGEAEVDARTDIWSLGTTLYEALTLQHPFGVDVHGRHATTVLVRSIRDRRPRGVHRINPGLRDEFDWILQRCLEQDRERRYPSAGALADDLERYLNNEPVEARPASLLYRSRKLLVRHRAPAAAGLFVAGLLIGQQLMYRTRLSSSDSLLHGVQAAESRQRQAVLELIQWLSSEIDFELMAKPLQTQGPSDGARAERMLEQLRELAVEQDAMEADSGSAFELRLVRSALANAEGEFERTMELLGDAPGHSASFGGAAASREVEQLVLLLLAHAQRETGDLEGALASADRLIEVMDKPANILLSRGNVLKDLGRPDEALASYGAGLERDPDSSWGFSQRATLRSTLGDAHGALADFEEAARLDPGDAGHLYNTAVLLGNMGRPKEAIAALDRVAAMSPEKALVYVSRGRYRGNAGDDVGALEDFDRAFELQPDGPPDWSLSRATVLIRVKRWQAAIDDANRYLEARPDHAWALEIRGISKSWLGDRDGALADYDRSIESGQRPSTYMQRGTCLAYMDRYEEALVDLARAHELGYRSTAMTSNRAVMLNELGRTDEALAVLEGETAPALVALRDEYRATLAEAE